MAILRGEGAMTNVNLIAKTYFNNATKDGKTQFLDVQIDHRDQRGADQSNLHLKSDLQQDGRYNNGSAYTADQFAKIRGAAGPNTEPVQDVNGNEVGRSFAFKGSLMPTKDNKGLVVNTNKELGQSDFKLEGKTMDDQFASMKEASERQKTEQAAAQAESPAPEAQTPATPAWANENPGAESEPEPAAG